MYEPLQTDRPPPGGPLMRREMLLRVCWTALMLGVFLVQLLMLLILMTAGSAMQDFSTEIRQFLRRADIISELAYQIACNSTIVQIPPDECAAF